MTIKITKPAIPYTAHSILRRFAGIGVGIGIGTSDTIQSITGDVAALVMNQMSLSHDVQANIVNAATTVAFGVLGGLMADHQLRDSRTLQTLSDELKKISDEIIAAGQEVQIGGLTAVHRLEAELAAQYPSLSLHEISRQRARLNNTMPDEPVRRRSQWELYRNTLTALGATLGFAMRDNLYDVASSINDLTLNHPQLNTEEGRSAVALLAAVICGSALQKFGETEYSRAIKEEDYAAAKKQHSELKTHVERQQISKDKTSTREI